MKSMGTQLMDVQPPELRFVVEAKKQSSCSIQLSNKTDQWLAFKVKTTSPKKYCVRPNVGCIQPNGTCEFTVTMQVQRAAALDLQCKDKFLVQSTVVAGELPEEEITSDMFAKGSGRPIEERKMRVFLIPSQSPLATVNGVTNQESSNDTSQKERISGGIDNPPPSNKELEGSKMVTPSDALGASSDVGTITTELTQEPATTKGTDMKESNTAETKSPSYWIEELKKQTEDLKSKIDFLGAKLAEAEQTVAKLTEERSKVLHEKELSKRELALMKRRVGARTVHVGFPLLYICMVALICLTVGYMMQPQEVGI